MLNFRLWGRRQVPFVGASELNECGLACLAAISAYFEGEPGLAEIRQLAVPSGRGETLLELRNLAERIGLGARGVKVGVNALAQLAVPAILHWDMNHFVVLERVTKNGIVIMDPAAGRLAVPWSAVDTSFTGVALETRVSPSWRKARGPGRKVSLLDFLAPLSQWRNDIALVVALSILMEVLVLLAPLQMQLSIDSALQGSDGRLVWVLAIGFTLVVLLQGAISVVRAWTLAVFGARVGYELKDRFVRALHRKSARFFLKHHSADILSRSRSVDTIQSLVTAQLLQALLDGAMSIAIVVVMLLAVPSMAAVVIVFAAINLLATAGLRRAAIDVSRRGLRVAAQADAYFLENARAARAIRLFGKELVRSNVWRNKFVDLTNLGLADGRLTMFSAQMSQLTNGLGNVALIALGTWLVLGNQITLGTMMMFFLFRAFLVERLNRAVLYAMELRRVRTNAERIEEVMADEAGVDDAAHECAFVVADGAGVRIEVKDVWFRYGNDTPWVLQGASLVVEPGESVAITGPSGSGKTTLLHLMIGLLEPNRGEVLVNGREVKTIASADLARAIGVVMQDDILFQGTVAENVSFFDTPIDMARVARAARQANVAAEIEAMPMQYHSMLAEAAADISGGQKQRLFIARALYHAPRVLFLDEATSHLDTASEALVSRAVEAMDITRVLVAHRKETIAIADRVVALEPARGLVRAVDAAVSEPERATAAPLP
ncbi:MAG TPA: peptidase domain-containing ABC transporter [Caldimonas sp.]|jgi:ATP-binding cassette subfamily B protein RaxB|nr:peptidase domain-containing ABC transporter [Caldimonas sp.]